MLWACAIALVLGSANPHLEPARQLVEQLNYPQAAAALVKARAHPGNDRATSIELVWLQGQVAATLGRTDEARGFFRLLCSIDPEFEVKGDFPPKVMGPFFEAKGWATTMGKLKFEALPPEVAAGKIVAVTVRVAADPLKLARRIRFRLKGSTASWYTVDATLAEPTATIAWAATTLEWWAELLGESDAVFATVGSRAKPILVETRSEAVLAPPLSEPEPQPMVSRSFFGPLRIVGVVGFGAAIATAVGGGVFRNNADNGSAQIRLANRNSTGAITGLTQREAFAIDDRARTDSSLATGLFAAAGIVGVGAALIFAFGSP